MQVGGDLLPHIRDGGVAVILLQIIYDKVVGQLVGVGFHNVVDGDGKDGVLAGQVGVILIGIGEGDLDIEGFAGLVADELLQEVINIAGDADGDLSAVAVGAAALEGDTVYLADIIDVEGIAILDGAVSYLVGIGVARHDGIDAGLDILLLDGGHLLGIGEVGVLAQGNVVLGGDALEPAVGGQSQAVIDGGVSVALLAGAGGQPQAEQQRHHGGQNFY